LATDILYIKNEERKGFVEISDEDLDFKQSELKKERSKLTRRQKEREQVQKELSEFKEQLEHARQRFSAAFHTEPETREILQSNEKNGFRHPTAWHRWKVKSGLCVKKCCRLPSPDNCLAHCGNRLKRNGNLPAVKPSRKTLPFWPKESSV
jgi:hypothetical protein